MRLCQSVYQIMIRNYLQLVRFPGIFTAFSNVLLGFFVSQNINFDWILLFPLLIASGSMFLAGMALNDFFDFKEDKKERPNRPLPSGKIKKTSALYIGIGFLIIANISTSFVGIQSLIISLIMTSLILAYVIHTKKFNGIGILNLSVIRFFNVILGTSIISFELDFLLFAIPIAIFVSGISILAKKETTSLSKRIEILAMVFVLIMIVYVTVFTITQDPIHYIFIGYFFLGSFF